MKKTIIIAWIFILLLIIILILELNALSHIKPNTTIISPLAKCHYIEDGGYKQKICDQK